MKSRKNRFLANFGLTVGIISGGVAAYFLAPKKGTDTQKMILKNVNKVTQKSISKVQEGLIQFEVALQEMDREDFRKN